MNEISFFWFRINCAATRPPKYLFCAQTENWLRPKNSIISNTRDAVVSLAYPFQYGNWKLNIVSRCTVCRLCCFSVWILWRTTSTDYEYYELRTVVMWFISPKHSWFHRCNRLRRKCIWATTNNMLMLMFYKYLSMHFVPHAMPDELMHRFECVWESIVSYRV